MNIFIFQQKEFIFQYKIRLKTDNKGENNQN